MASEGRQKARLAHTQNHFSSCTSQDELGYDDLAPKSVEFSKRAKHNRGDKSLPGNTEYENYSVADKDRVETEAMSSDVSGMSKEGEGLRYDSPSDPKIKSNKPKERRMGEINQPGGFA